MQAIATVVIMALATSKPQNLKNEDLYVELFNYIASMV